jgi:hypothetical protein
MFDQSKTFSELVEIAKRNGDFKRNYGTIIGALLYLRSISAVRGRAYLWPGVILAFGSAALILLQRLGLSLNGQ